MTIHKVLDDLGKVQRIVVINNADELASMTESLMPGWTLEKDSGEDTLDLNAVSAYPTQLKLIANTLYGKELEMTNDQVDMLIDKAVKEIIDSYLGTRPIPTNNDYEMACSRFERISHAMPMFIRMARRLEEMSNDEYDNAQDNLRQYESAPGIALPEYRNYVITGNQSGGNDIA